MAYQDVPTELMAKAEGWHHTGKQQYQGFVNGVRHHIARLTEGDSEQDAENTRKIMMVQMAEMLATTVEAAFYAEIQDEDGNPAPPEIREMLQESVIHNLVQLATFAVFDSAMGEPVEDSSVEEIAQLNNLFALDGSDDES